MKINRTSLLLQLTRARSDGLRILKRTLVIGGFALATASQTEAQITNGLAVHLAFENNYNDSSGNGINGTAVGSPVFVSGQIGEAVSVTTLKDGSKFDYVSLGYPDLLKFSSNVDFTVSYWCNYTNQIDDPPFVSNKNWSSSDNIGWGIFTQGSGNFRVNVTGDGGGVKQSTSSTPPIRDGKWHNVVVSFARQGSVGIYLDGALALTNDLSGTTGTIDTDDQSYSVNIGQDGKGAYTDGGGAQMIGVGIDDLAIWRRVLTSDEVSRIYNNGLVGKSFDVDLAVAAPTIVSEPQDQTHFGGVTVPLTVVATGISDNYQWKLNGQSIAGATNSTLILTNLQSSQGGAYTVAVSNSGGAITNQPFNLTVVDLSAGSPVTNAVAAHLSFDSKYTDSSPNGLDGTAVGTPTFVPGPIAQAVSVTTLKDGSEFDFVTLGYPDLLKFSSNVDFTISFWCNYTNQVDDPPFISNKNWSSSDNVGWGIFTQGDGTSRVNVTGDGGGAKESRRRTPVIRDGKWHNVAVSFVRQGFVNIYVDGGFITSDPLAQTTGSIDTDPQTFAVNIGQDVTGTYTDGGSAEMVGMMIDDLGIWRRALTTQEIEYIYLSGLEGKSFDAPPRQSIPKVTGQWDFDQGDLRATVGQDMQYGDGTNGLVKSHTSFGTTTSFGIPDIGGKPANVMKFTRIEPDEFPDPTDQNPRGYLTPHGMAPNGGGTKVNQFTMIVDMMNPDLHLGDGYNTVVKWEAVDDFTVDGSISIQDNDKGGDNTGGIGISGQYSGDGLTYIIGGKWQRIVVAVDMASPEPTISYYIDGVRFGVMDHGDRWGFDQRHAIPPVVRLYGDGENDDEVNTYYVNSVQFRDGTITPAEAAALGAATADGIPAANTSPPPAGPTISIAQNGASLTLSWAASDTGFTLESADSLSNATWTAVSGVANNSVTVQTGAGSKFYRLRK